MPMKLSAYSLAKVCGVPRTRIERLIREETPVTADTALNGGIPLLSSKQLFQIDPVDTKSLAKGAHTKDLPEIALEENMIVLTRSGTIGRVSIIPRYMEGWAGSEHATRILGKNPTVAGYLVAWLASAYGQCLVQRHAYGLVILEIDKEMIDAIPVPRADEGLIKEVGERVLRANQLRTAAFEMESAAVLEIEETISKLSRGKNTNRAKNTSTQ